MVDYNDVLLELKSNLETTAKFVIDALSFSNKNIVDPITEDEIQKMDAMARFLRSKISLLIACSDFTGLSSVLDNISLKTSEEEQENNINLINN